MGAQGQGNTSPLGQGPEVGEEGLGQESHILHSQVDEGLAASRYPQSPSGEDMDPLPVNFLGFPYSLASRRASWYSRGG